jgi:hypothetical protein
MTAPRLPALRKEERQRTLGVRIAAPRLDLDDVGAEIGEQATGECAPKIGQVNDAQVLERADLRAHRLLAHARPVVQR